METLSTTAARSPSDGHLAPGCFHPQTLFSSSCSIWWTSGTVTCSVSTGDGVMGELAPGASEEVPGPLRPPSDDCRDSFQQCSGSSQSYGETISNPCMFVFSSRGKYCADVTVPRVNPPVGLCTGPSCPPCCRGTRLLVVNSPCPIQQLCN